MSTITDTTKGAVPKKFKSKIKSKINCYLLTGVENNKK